MNNLYNMMSRSRRGVSIREFGQKNGPVEVSQIKLSPPTERQYILRMLIDDPKGGLAIPPELKWIFPLYGQAYLFQSFMFGPVHPFAYVTIRHGEVTTKTDDVWHTDGFSVKKPHGPEHDYIWCSDSPTEFLPQAFTFPADFDPMKHNVHQYFQDHADESLKVTGKPDTIYLTDPYVVHRRAPDNVGTFRTFVRVSFVPIEIEDNKNTPNPLKPTRVYTNTDLRLELSRYGA